MNGDDLPGKYRPPKAIQSNRLSGMQYHLNGNRLNEWLTYHSKKVKAFRENSPCRRQFRVIVCLEYAISSEWKLVQSTAMTYGSKNVMAFQQNCLSRMWQLPAFVWQERCWKRWRSTLDGMDLRMSQIRHFHFGGMHCSSCEAVPVTMGSN